MTLINYFVYKMKPHYIFKTEGDPGGVQRKGEEPCYKSGHNYHNNGPILTQQLGKSSEFQGLS